MEKNKIRRFHKKISIVSLVFFLSMVFILSNSTTVEAARMSLSAKSTYLSVGQKKNIIVENPTGKVTWSSSNKKIVKIGTKSGRQSQKVSIQAVKAGKATVTAKIGSKKLNASITVKKPKINTTRKSIKENAVFTITASNIGTQIKWTSSNSAVASVTFASGSNGEKAVVKGFKAGQTTITATVGSTQLKCNVTVSHNFKPATCTSPQTCTVCGATRGTKLGHNYESDRCIRCGLFNLSKYVTMYVTNVPSQSIVPIYVVNAGTADLQICTNNTSWGEGQLYLANQSRPQTVWLWDNDRGEYYYTLECPSGVSGVFYFSNEYEWNTDPNTRIEFDIYYDHVKYHVKVGNVPNQFEFIRK